MSILNEKVYFEEPVLDRFYNGVSPQEKVLAKFQIKIGEVSLINLFSVAKNTEILISKEEDIWVKNIDEEIFVSDRAGFTKIVQIIRRKVYEDVYLVRLENFHSIVSKSHKFLVIDKDEELFVSANSLKKGDTLLTLFSSAQPKLEKISSVEKISPDFKFLYGLVTESSSAYINGIFGKSY